jgi:hypothetical protein
MDGKTAALRERWRQRTDAAFERMRAGMSEEELVTFTEREDMAVLIGKELAAFLLKENVAQDAAVEPPEATATCCPKCGQPAKPASATVRRTTGPSTRCTCCPQDSSRFSTSCICWRTYTTRRTPIVARM